MGLNRPKEEGGTMKNLVCVGIFSLAGVACACSSTSKELPSESKGESKGETPPGNSIRVGIPLEGPVDTFLDDSGRRWIFVRKIDDYDDSPPVPPSNNRPDRDVNLMSDAELTAYYRPRGDFGGYEYTMADDDALAFALELREITNNPTSTGGDDDPNAPPAQQPDERQYHAIINSDNRINVNANSWQTPDIWNGREVNRCTVFKMSNDFTAVTAAHCVHNGSTFKSRRGIQFGAPAAPRPEYPFQCIGVVVPGCFDEDDPPTVSCDYAVMKLRDSGTPASCLAQSSSYTVGHLGWNSIADCATFPAHVSGYPLPPPNGWTYPTLVYHFRNDAETTCWPYPYPDRAFYDNDTTEGQSGAPLVSFFNPPGVMRVRAIHSGSFDSFVDLTNNGRRMTQALRNWLVSNGGS
jgi:V8-like Glu-specific endopeptidase